MNESIENLKRILKVFKVYHRYKAVGIENIPLSGGALLVTNHSLATYDGFLLGLEIYDQRNRLSRGLGDDLLFRVPVLRDWCDNIGLVPASLDNAKNLLRDGEILGVAPGGMREALRPSSERYQLKWHKRKGFIRLAILEQVPIILAACPNADRIFKVYESFFTSLFYRNFKVPIPIFKGFGPTYIPRPVKLTHFISKPIYPPKINDSRDINDSLIDDFHRQIISEMNDLMDNVTYSN